VQNLLHPDMVKSSNFAYDAIRKDILDGRYQPRAHLREAAIAADIGVSRTPVREALRRLAADGYVTMVPNHGAFVNPQSDESLSELITVRAELAALAAAGAARNIDVSKINMMEEIVRRMSQIECGPGHESIDEQTALNLEFNKLIFENCGNRWLNILLRQTSNVANVQRAYYSFSADDWSRAVARYAEMIQALRMADSEWAGAIFKSHFLASMHAINSHAAHRKSTNTPVEKPAHRPQAIGSRWEQ
jgi:DNA-binding GntR family transcriptional regulator